MRPKAPINITMFLFTPSIVNPGIVEIMRKLIDIGMKQAMNIAEIIVTILATFSFLLEILWLWLVMADVSRHLFLLYNFKTNTMVHVIMTTNAANGSSWLLMTNVMLSTISRCFVETRPSRVLFLWGKNFRPRWLTANTGEEVMATKTKMLMIIMDVVFLVIIILTCKMLQIVPNQTNTTQFDTLEHQH